MGNDGKQERREGKGSLGAKTTWRKGGLRHAGRKKKGRKEGRRQEKIGKRMNERKERRRKARRQEFRHLPFLHPYQEKTPLQQIFFSSHLQCGKIS